MRLLRSTRNGIEPVNSASTPTLIYCLRLKTAPWTCVQAQMQPAHMSTGLDDQRSL